MSRVESGDRPGGKGFWRAAAAALAVSEQWLLTGTDDASLELADAQRSVRSGEPGGLGALRALLDREGVTDETRAVARGELVDALVSRGRYAEAIPLLTEALEHPSSDPMKECGDRMRLTRCLAESGDLHTAVDVSRPMLDVIEDLDLHQTLPAIQLKVTLAGVLTMRGDLLSAQQLLDGTVMDAAVSGSDAALASVMWNSAHLAREQGQPMQAERLAGRAVQLFDSAGDMRRYAATLVVWADVALDCAHPDLGVIEERLSRGLDLVKKHGDSLEIGYACHDLGRLRIAQGRIGDAFTALDEALASLGPDHPVETARCLVTRAALGLVAGDSRIARESAQRARNILKAVTANYRTRRLWTALAEDYYCAAGDMGSAIDCYRYATAPWHPEAERADSAVTKPQTALLD